MSRAATLVALAGLALVVSAGSPSAGTASASPGSVGAAHNVLIGSDPEDGARLAAGPARIRLVFNLPVQPGFSVVTVTGPDGNQWQAGPATEDGAVVSAPVRTLGPAGDYVIGYRVLSADGHPVRGVVQFTLTTPGTGTAAPAPDTGTVGTTPAGQPKAGSTPWWPWLVGAGALLAAGVVVALRIGRAS